MTLKVTPVILCGGAGSRLWPLSRSGFPKQFLVLSEKNSLFQQAIERLNNLADEDLVINPTIVVANEDHRFLVLDQLREFPSLVSNLLLEPVAKNTAPAVTLAALTATSSGEDPVLVVTPADQAIVNLNALQKSLQKAIHAASDGSLVILGVKPIAPETGYGYIRTNKISDKDSAYLVEEFAEKPDIQTAKLYFDSGDYVWNSGMFVFKASAWLKALKFFSPDIFYLTSKSFEQSKCDGKFVRPDADVFLKIPSDSVDYAVLEKCQGTDYKIKMIELDAGWNDLGAWDAVWQMSDKDNNRNVFHGDVLTHNSKNSLVHASHRLVGVVGLENVLVVETADAVLVANRHSAQQVKEIVEKLKCSKREEHILHRKVNRPWGWYDTLDFGPRFKVKRILVNPGGKLSLQKHAKRAEHWIVVRGKAQVICEDNHFILNENESTFIPLGLLHRLSNPFDEPLEIIEVQSGSYLGEDDIQRFDDCYGREGRGA